MVVKHIPVALLCLIIARSVVLGAQIPESIMILALCGLTFSLHLLDSTKENKLIQQDLNNLRADLETHKKEISEHKQYVTGLKMATSLSAKR